MIRYILNRFLYLIFVLIGVLLIVFILGRCAGDPIPSILGTEYTQEEYHAKEVELGLDQPYVVQFFNYVKGIITHFDLGISYSTKRAVKEEIITRLPLSLKLAFIALLWSVPFGVFCGVISAVRQYRPSDYILTTLAMIMAAMPGFWAAMMMILFFSLKLNLVPATGLYTWQGYILPCIAIGLHPQATFCRMTRSAMLETIHSDYIRTARSKGLNEKTVILKHCLRNSAIPIVTTLGTVMSLAIGNASVVERVFNIPGLGSYMVSSISLGDYQCVQGTVLVFSLIVCVINLGVDLLYGVIDPRIQSRYASAGWKARREMNRIMKAAREGTK